MFFSIANFMRLSPVISVLNWRLMYSKEANNRKQEIDRQHHTIPNQRKQRPKDKHYGICQPSGICSCPHLQKALKIGIMLFPFSDKQYSTLGGTWGYSLRITMPSFSNSFSWLLSILCVTFPNARFISLQRRISFFHSQNKMCIFRFPTCWLPVLLSSKD